MKCWWLEVRKPAVKRSRSLSLGETWLPGAQNTLFLFKKAYMFGPENHNSKGKHCLSVSWFTNCSRILQQQCWKSEDIWMTKKLNFGLFNKNCICKNDNMALFAHKPLIFFWTGGLLPQILIMAKIFYWILNCMVLKKKKKANLDMELKSNFLQNFYHKMYFKSRFLFLIILWMIISSEYSRGATALPGCWVNLTALTR